MRPQVILFDLDGTLIDSLYDIAAAANHALERIGREPRTRDEVRRFVGDGARALIERCLDGEGDVETAFRLFRDHYERHALEHTRLHPGVADLLERVATLPCAVISNKREDFCARILKELGVAHRFALIAGGDTFLDMKPSPVPLRSALDILQADPARACMVGDGPQDMAAARAARIPAIGVLWGFNDAATLKQAGANHLVETPAALGDLLLGPHP